MIEKLLANFAKVYNTLTLDKVLLPYEELVLDAWKEALSNDYRKILDEQLCAAKYLQRQAGGAKICFYYPDNATVRLFPTKTAETKAGIITLGSPNNEIEMRVKIFVVNGKFFSIEFPKRPEVYMEIHGMDKDRLYVKNIEIDPAFVSS